MSEDLISRCQGMWRSILPALGIPATALTGKKGPCPICGGNDRFRFDDRKPAGSGSWICNQCGAGYGVHLLERAHGWSRYQAFLAIEDFLDSSPEASVTPPPAEKSEESTKALDHALSIWKASVRIEPDNASGRYLARRGLVHLSDVTWLRHGQKVVYLDEDGMFCGWFPAMLAVLKAPDGAVVALHRTFLTGTGEKADVPAVRKTLGAMPGGAAVRLSSHGETLGIAEGIETALSASALFGIPCWAALNANGLEKWTPPDGVKEVIVFGDNDAKFRGQAAAFALAHRLSVKGLRVRVEIPPVTDGDWNDVLLNQRRVTA